MPKTTALFVGTEKWTSPTSYPVCIHIVMSVSSVGFVSIPRAHCVKQTPWKSSIPSIRTLISESTKSDVNRKGYRLEFNPVIFTSTRTTPTCSLPSRPTFSLLKWHLCEFSISVVGECVCVYFENLKCSFLLVLGRCECRGRLSQD